MRAWTTIATASTIVNATTMGLSIISHDWKVFTISYAGAAFSGYGRIFFKEDAIARKPQSYRTLAMRLRYEITEETGWEPGDKLPSQRELATQFSTTRVTVTRAIELLADEGLVVIIAGRGTFIAGGHAPTRRRAEVESHLRDKASYQEDLGTVEYLARTLNASQSTVRRVLHGLIEEGLLRRRSDGTYVRT